MVKRRYKRRKTTPLQEIGFLALICVALLIFGNQQFVVGDNTLNLVILILSVGLIVGATLYSFLLWQQSNKRKALRALEMSHIDEMSGVEFENYLVELLSFQGYKVITTPPTGDFGVDIIASKGGIKTAIQAKRYKKKINQDAIREVVAGKMVRQYGCTRAVVITTSTFTKHAKYLASETDCELIDREKLAEWVLDFQKEKPGKWWQKPANL